MLISVRVILFCAVWAITIGKHHFWFLPNLTEDVGFFDSFKPLYKHDVHGSEKEKKTKEKEKSKEEKEESEEGDNMLSQSDIDGAGEPQDKTEQNPESPGIDSGKAEADSGKAEAETPSGSEGNGYEIVNPEELEEEESEEGPEESKKTK